MQSENHKKTIYAAILGAGTVGTGVYKLCQEMKSEFVQKTGADLVVKKVLVRNASKKREGIEDAVLTDNWKEIIEDPEIDIVIEVMGGIEPAKTYIIEALEAGKQIVTANKDLLAEHGQEVMAAAEKAGADLEFEAAVAGAIPIIRPLKQSMAGNRISEVMGIVNGTTNYILTKMSEKGMDYAEALAQATELGYAEADPTADVEGYDACRKIAILSSLISGQQVDFEDIYCEGITKITVEDMKYAKAMGTTIKLLASSRRYAGNRLHAIVAPCMLYPEHPLYNVNDVFNAIFVHGNVLGDAMFYGSGAGKLPTASAVVADVVDEAKHLNRNIMTMWKEEKLQLEDKADSKRRFFVRIKGKEEELVPQLKESYGEIEVVKVPELEGEFGFVTPVMMEGDYETRSKLYKEQIVHMIRIQD